MYRIFIYSCSYFPTIRIGKNGTGYGKISLFLEQAPLRHPRKVQYDVKLYLMLRINDSVLFFTHISSSASSASPVAVLVLPLVVIRTPATLYE